MDWSYFNKFDKVDEKYLPPMGEGETKATQICTAVSKLVYKWYNDGDVFDNTHYMEGWCNDLSSYANWLWKNVPESEDILVRIFKCSTSEEYEQLLADLCDTVNTEEFLGNCAAVPKVGTVYECIGPFRFVDKDDDEDERGWW